MDFSFDISFVAKIHSPKKRKRQESMYTRALHINSTLSFCYLSIFSFVKFSDLMVSQRLRTSQISDDSAHELFYCNTILNSIQKIRS